MVAWLGQVIEAFVTDVDQRLQDVRLIDAVEQQRILADWSRGPASEPGRPRTIPELLEPSRQYGTGRVAVRCAGREIDYPALHRLSDNFARLLADHGVGPGSLVGLSDAPGHRIVVALVGIVKARGYFRIDRATRRRASSSCSAMSNRTVVVAPTRRWTACRKT
ncbi:hypothetical protein H7I76_21950, partial [Mycolicibacterium vaccae]|nr:hypothetical protein [Mycolicibacterium vaccae]